ncbi:hypothetical protein DV736_g648, partial [Chaetothyriales sp. CBS 134916]
MARRLSAIFSLSKDDTDAGSDHSLAQKLSNSQLNQPAQPSRQHNKTQSSSSETGSQATATLAPPPLFMDNSLVRPPSSHGSSSRPQSRGSSAQSGDRRSRPQTPTTLISDAAQSPSQSPAWSPSGPTTPASAKPIKRRSRFLTKGDKSSNENGQRSRAWIVGLKDHVPYDLKPLLQGEPVPELWHDHGDTLVHLYSRLSGRGPSFKVHSSLFADSQALNMLRFEALTAAHETSAAYQTVQSHRPTLSVQSPPSNANSEYRAPGANWESERYEVPSIKQDTVGEVHVWLPLELDRPIISSGEEPQREDLELIVLYRNFFAFLFGGALIATPRQHGLYAIFMGISSMLRKYRFGDGDGSTWGHVPTASFSHYCEELPLADIRFNRERAVEAIVLGEQMRYWPLYNEGFVHATGILDEIKATKSPKLTKISHITLNRLERAHIDLESRLLAVQQKLDKFDFPSMFSGAANSQTSIESKTVNFRAWKEAFFDFQKFVLAHYKRKYGAWPPKASSKKNNFEESGLNRLVLRDVYQDFTELYDMLVDRTCLTPRTDGMLPASSTTAHRGIESIQHALRVIESEHDRATPPVAPPIPFDIPILPAFANSFDRTHVVELSTRARSAASVKLKQSDVSAILLGSCNRDKIQTSAFIQEFINYERKLGDGKTLNDVLNNRCGQWLFMYAVLQSLPMTVVDARDVKFTDGVEYFLCIGPRGGRPWMKEDTSQSRAWYNVASGGGFVSLPADMIDHSVEGIYRRSHCWQAATKWVTDGAITSPQDDIRPQNAPGLAPTGLLAPSLMAGSQAGAAAGSPQVRSSSLSPSGSPLLRPQSTHSEGRQNRMSSQSLVNLGLEAAAAPPSKAPRPVSVLNPNITFDTILADSGLQGHGKTKKKPGFGTDYSE